MSNDDILDLYRMLKTACDVIDVLLVQPDVDAWLMNGNITDQGREILNEYATMRRLMVPGPVDAAF